MLHDLARAVLPQLLYIAEQPKLVARLQVPAQRGAVRALAAPEVIRPVPVAAVVVAEHDGAKVGQIDVPTPGVPVCLRQPGADPLGVSGVAEVPCDERPKSHRVTTLHW